MEQFAQLLIYAIPAFVLLVLIEWVIAYRMKVEINNSFDVISSLSSGMTFIVKEMLGLSVIILSYEWMVGQFALIEFQSNLIIYILCFIGLDFAGYWSHRFNHEYNILWNRHIIHHSSEEFNLSCALRQSISEWISIYFFLYIPLAILGIPAEVIAVVAPLHLFAQFWYHTRLINKMGFLEHILVTPSHHRVHHAINDKYIDKNYSQIFIVWDKWFGTFQEELVDEPAVYGIKKPANTWNPFVINYMHLYNLGRDAFFTSNWLDKFKIWMMPTGWRPEDVKNRFPLEVTVDVHNRDKYQSPASSILVIWSWFQMLVAVSLLYILLINIGRFDFGLTLGFCGLLFISIFAYTSLMDRNRWSTFAEVVRLILLAYFFFTNSQILNLSSFGSMVFGIISLFAILSFLLNLYFMSAEKLDQSQLQSQ